MNHMKEAAKMLGVELGEEFEIEGVYGNPFRLTECGMYDCCDRVMSLVLHNLITGNYEVVKKPWIPKDGEKVWAIYSDPEPIIGETHFVSQSYNDLSRFALGCLCRTREEAEAHADEIQEQMRRILVGELRAELVEVRK